MGTGASFAGRVRASLRVQHRTDAVGTPGLDRLELSEQRLEGTLAYAPFDWLMLSATLPVLHRTITHVNLAQDEMLSLGDAELRTRVTFWQDRDFAPLHRLSFHAGVELPTGPVERDAEGRLRDPELQPGSGSFDPLVGLGYTFSNLPWSLYTSHVLYVPTWGSAGFRPGMSLRSTLTGQYQLQSWLGLRLGADTRLEQPTHIEGQGEEPDSGGFIAFLSPAVVLSPLTDLVLQVFVRMPVINALIGQHDEGPVVGGGAAYDF